MDLSFILILWVFVGVVKVLVVGDFFIFEW